MNLREWLQERIEQRQPVITRATWPAGESARLVMSRLPDNDLLLEVHLAVWDQMYADRGLVCHTALTNEPLHILAYMMPMETDERGREVR